MPYPPLLRKAPILPLFPLVSSVVVLLFSEERMWMLFPVLRWMSLALTVLPLTVMSSLAIIAAVLPAVIRLPLVSSVTVSA